MGDPDNARIWLNADVYVGELGSTPPTDIETPLDAAFEAVGLLGEDGMTRGRSLDQQDHFDYAGTLIRSTNSKHKETIKIVCLEDNPLVWELVNPGSGAEADGGVTTRTYVVPRPVKKAWVIETVDEGITRRRFIESGAVTEVGEIQTTSTAIEAKELTITLYANEAGEYMVDITDDPQAEPEGS